MAPQSPRRSEAAREPRAAPRERDSFTGSESDVSEGVLLVGEVAAVDPESGQLILSTDSGVLSVWASTDDVQDVRIGDVIRVALFD